jgi:hypothetical protein
VNSAAHSSIAANFDAVISVVAKRWAQTNQINDVQKVGTATNLDLDQFPALCHGGGPYSHTATDELTTVMIIS